MKNSEGKNIVKPEKEEGAGDTLDNLTGKSDELGEKGSDVLNTQSEEGLRHRKLSLYYSCDGPCDESKMQEMVQDREVDGAKNYR